MGKRIDLSDSTYGRLTVIRLSHRNEYGALYWLCVCVCGAKTVVRGSHLRGGRSQSCGCFATEQAKARNTKHGHNTRRGRTPEYHSYMSMLTRCYNHKHIHYDNYGGRGITVCRRWRGPKGFENFLADMGPRPNGMTLDRKNGSKGYSPNNCRWATRKQQTINRTLKGNK